MTMELRVSFRGKPLNVDGLDPAAPLSELKEHLEKLTMVPVANQKLVSPSLITYCGIYPVHSTWVHVIYLKLH